MLAGSVLRLRVLLIASVLALVPALCGAQSDPASMSGSGTSSSNAPAADAPQSKGLFDWLTKPQANKPSTPAAGARGAAPAQAPAESPAPAAPAATGTSSTTTPPAVVNPVSPTPSMANTPAMPSNGARAYTPPPAVSAPSDIATPAPAVVAPPAVPRSGIALILPAKADGFARAAEVTRKGFMAAREQDPGKPAVTVFETDGSASGAQEAYQQALAKNVAVIVGPLTKGEVAALQNERFPVPTLMLNSPDGPLNNVPGLYMLALSTESEARAAAEAAFRPGVSSAVVVTTMSPLSKRASTAFQEAWTNMGGTVKDVIEYTGNPVKIKSAVDRARAQIVFLAADTDRARLIKPFLGRNTAVIGTSQVYSGNARVEAPGGAGAVDPQKTNDLNGLRFIDMPWLHQPDHPAAMVFAHPEPPLSADLERLYALGIDAYRVAEQLRRSRTSFELDGVTGRLNVHEGLIDRQPIEAEYRDGAVVPLENSVLAHGEGGGARGTVR